MEVGVILVPLLICHLGQVNFSPTPGYSTPQFFLSRSGISNLGSAGWLWSTKPFDMAHRHGVSIAFSSVGNRAWWCLLSLCHYGEKQQQLWEFSPCHCRKTQEQQKWWLDPSLCPSTWISI